MFVMMRFQFIQFKMYSLLNVISDNTLPLKNIIYLFKVQQNIIET